MKSFAVNDIKYRMLLKLKENSYWSKIAQDSSIDSLLSVICEGISENDRYFEYNSRERTWDYAQNMSSILGQTSFFGYKPRRKVSAIGDVYISHDIELLSLLGVSGLSTLTTYSGADLPVSFGKVLPSTIPFSNTQSITYTSGNTYAMLPCIQGTTQTISTSDQKTIGLPFETIRINVNSIEAALDDISSAFFSVTLTLPDTTVIVFSEVENILIAGEDDWAYEVTNVFTAGTSELECIELKFGNNVSGRMLPANCIVSCTFLDTLGESGNVSTVGELSGTISLGTGENVLYFKNLAPLVGGKDIESIAEIKANAPIHYLLDGAVISQDQYIKNIENIPYINKASVYEGIFTDPITSLLRNAIMYTAITILGKAPEASSFELDVNLRLLGKKAPLDFLVYVPPNLIGLEINYQANIASSKFSNVSQVISDIKDILFARYSILNMKFNEPLAPLDIPLYLENNYVSNFLKNTSIFLEARINLPASSFSVATNLFKYEQNFVFDSSFTSMYHNKDTYLMRVDFVWSCTNCQYKNKTVFVFFNKNWSESTPAISYYTVKQYPLLKNILTKEYIESILFSPSSLITELTVDSPTCTLYDAATESNITYEYYPIEVKFDNTSELMNSTLLFPIVYNDTPYIDYTNFSSEQVDADVQINVYSYPLNYNAFSITPLLNGSIFEVLENDIKVEIGNI